MNEGSDRYYEQLAEECAAHVRMNEPNKLVSHWCIEGTDLVCIVDNLLGGEFKQRQRFLGAVRARLLAEGYEEVGQAAWAPFEPDDADWTEALLFRGESDDLVVQRIFEELMPVWRALFGGSLRN